MKLTAVRARRSRRSDGVLVEASILARLLGIKLLTLDATVLVVPADLDAPSPAPLPAPPPRRPPAGTGLAHAVRSLIEGAELLAEARRDHRGPTPRALHGR